MVGNIVLRRRVSGAAKPDFWPYNWRYTSPNEHFEYGYPHSNALFNIYSSNIQYFAPNWSFVINVKQLCQPITSDVTYDVGAPTIHRRIYWHKFQTLSNQTSRYIRKCIKMFTDNFRQTHYSRLAPHCHSTSCRLIYECLIKKEVNASPNMIDSWTNFSLCHWRIRATPKHEVLITNCLRDYRRKKMAHQLQLLVHDTYSMTKPTKWPVHPVKIQILVFAVR